MNLSTRYVRFDQCPGDPYRPTSTPIYQTATFEQEDPDAFGRYDYSRSGNPTRDVLEAQLAGMEAADPEAGGGAAPACAFASGMAAIAAVTRLVRPGERIVSGLDIYGGTHRLLTRLVEPLGIGVDFADTTDAEALAAALRPATRLILIESPSNPLHRVSDIRALARSAREHGALLAVDSTMMSPYLQRPLDLGADLVIHSATKYLCGHGDVTAGAVIAPDPELAARIRFVQNAEGTALGPFESWLLLRGLRTLALRIDRQQAGARAVASFLREHPAVRRVRWVGLEDHPGHALHASQASGPGAVLSFETGSWELSRAVVERTQLFSTTVSFGGIGSSISLPCRMSHASIPEHVRRARELPDDLVRISVGIEDSGDLIEDLEAAFGSGGRIRSKRIPGRPRVASR